MGATPGIEELRCHVVGGAALVGDRQVAAVGVLEPACMQHDNAILGQQPTQLMTTALVEAVSTTWLCCWCAWAMLTYMTDNAPAHSMLKLRSLLADPVALAL